MEECIGGGDEVGSGKNWKERKERKLLLGWKINKNKLNGF